MYSSPKCTTKTPVLCHLHAQEVILELLKRAMLSRLKTSLGFLIDGYPRDEEQLVAFEEEVRGPQGLDPQTGATQTRPAHVA